MEDNKKVRAFAGDMRSHIKIYLSDGVNRHAKNIEFVDNPNHEYVESSINIGFTAAQQLMDDLWYAGVRPTEGSGSAGSLKATENHLADMQKIAFKMLDRDEKRESFP